VVEKARVTGTSVVTGEIRVFSFFTILTNLLVALVLLSVVVQATSGRRIFLARPTIQAAFAVYIIVVGVVYNLMLRHIWNPQGWQKVADEIFHDLVPVAYVVYWLTWAPKGHTRWLDAVRWLAYPLAYGAYTLIRGEITETYPYPFLNVNNLGYPHVLLNMLILTVAIFGLSCFIIAIDHWLGKCPARQALKGISS